jgi:hypothetical protein
MFQTETSSEIGDVAFSTTQSGNLAWFANQMK